MTYIISGIIAYLFGCIQTGYIVGRLFLKKDIRTMGNGNAGASNATVVFGKKFGAVTAAVDIIKSILGLALVRYLYEDKVSAGDLQALLHLSGLFVILGHNFPFYMKFKGGKGTAALIGVLFALDIKLGFIGLLTLIIITLLTDYIAAGTMALLIVLLINMFLYPLQPVVVVSDLLIIGMSIYKHRMNLVRIKNGNEKSVRKALFKKS